MARTLIPAMTRVIDETFAAKIDELAQQAAAAQAQWQQAALQQLDATMREICRSSSRPVVNINTTARHEGDLDKVNVEAPENAEAAARLRSAASPLTKFLREQWLPTWTRAGVRHTSCTLQFSILMQARAVSALRRRALPSRAPQAAKTKELQAQGRFGRYVGQIGRAQAFYTAADVPLMRRVFEDDLWPVRAAAVTAGGALNCRVASGRSGGHRCSKRSCGCAALSSKRCLWALWLLMRIRRRDASTHSLRRSPDPLVARLYLCVPEIPCKDTNIARPLMRACFAVSRC